MPHCILEISDQVPDKPDFRAFFGELHTMLAASGDIQLDHIKSRLRTAEHCYVGSGAADNQFVYLQISLLAGRSLERRQAWAEHALGLLQKYFPRTVASPHVSMTVELREMDRATHVKLSTGAK
jgi:5-carboxymethyl-2-hydroxymuconate isomerase